MSRLTPAYGSLAIILTFGLLLARMFMGKYVELGWWEGRLLYRQALLADNGLVLALLMWTVAAVTVLVSLAAY